MVAVMTIIFFVIVLAILYFGGKAMSLVYDLQDSYQADIRGAMSPDYDHMRKWRT